MAETLMSSDKFIASSAVTAFVRRGVKLVALDFDQTIVDIHTGGAWRGPSSSLVPHVRPCFKALIQAVLEEPRLHLCVVTFSTQPGMIEDVLRAALPNWYLVFCCLCMLCAIDQFALSTDGAAPSTDLLFAQASIDRAAIDGSRCAIDR